MTETAAGESMFLIIDRAGWHEAPIQGGVPTPISLDETLSHLGSATERWAGEGAGVAPRARGSIHLTPADCVERVWAMVGRVYEGFLLFEDTHCGAMLIDQVDCRLLDALAPGRALSDIEIEGIDQAELCGRAGRLLAAGLVDRGVAHVPEAPAPPVEHAAVGATSSRFAALQELNERVTYAVRASSKLQKVRDLIGLSPSSGGSNGQHSGSPAVESNGVSTNGSLVASADPAAAADEDGQESGADDPRPVDSRIPIYAVWHENVGPLLSLGMLTATARVWNDGALNEHFEVRKPETAESVLEDLPHRPGPAVLLCSGYVWSIDANLALAAEAKALNPELIILHGGPSSPKYEPDAAQFFVDHADVTDILVRGEGEHVFCEVLETIAAAKGLDPERLGAVGSLTFRGTDGELVRTDEYPRIKDLDVLPSPYLTGEFDHISSAA